MFQTIFLFAVEAVQDLATEVSQEAPEGGLFDINATLPLIAIQTLLLVAILDKVFYKPFTQVLDDRSDYIRTTQLSTQERLTQAKQTATQYEQELADTRKEAQAVITKAQAEAQQIAANQIAEAQKEAQQKRENAQREIDSQKQAALQTLEQQVDSLSDQILVKLLGT